MVDKISVDQVMLLFKISRAEADALISISAKKGISLAKAKMMLDLAKKDSKEKGISIGTALFQLESTLNLNRMMTKKRNSTKDRRDVQYIPKKFSDKIPGGKEIFKDKNNKVGGSSEFRITSTGKREYRNIYDTLNVKDDHFINPKKYMPVYHHQENEVPSFRPLPPPKYYYFGLNGEFYARGHDSPPSTDPDYRIDKAKNIPFIKAEVAYVRQASKYPKPVYDDNGTPVIGADGQQLFKKDHGKRIIKLDFYVGSTFILAKNVEMDYEDDVKFNILKGQDLSKYIKEELYQFGNEYGDRNVWIYKSHKKSIEPTESEKKYKEYYELERKRKLKRSRAVRKKVIKKKIVKKPIKKCICRKKVIKKR